MVKNINLRKYAIQLANEGYTEESKTLAYLMLFLDEEDINEMTWKLVETEKLPYPNDFIEEIK